MIEAPIGQYHFEVWPNAISDIKSEPQLLSFEGLDNGVVVFNPTAPFLDTDGSRVIAARVESSTTADATIRFFRPNGEKWAGDESLATFRLEDPNLTRIEGQVVLIGIQTYPIVVNGIEEVGYRTVFYRGEDIRSLREFAVGPDGMKDIRLIELDGRIGVFTRPQGEKKGGRGKIGFTQIDALTDLTPQVINEALLIPDQFGDEKWGGVNALYLLPGEKIGVLSHIAYFDEKENKHYYATAFIFDPKTCLASPTQTIAQVSDFVTLYPDLTKPAEGLGEKGRYTDIFFPGGLELREDVADLYGGLNNRYAGKITIRNPFSLDVVVAKTY